MHNLKAISIGVVPNLGFRVSHNFDIFTNELSGMQIEVKFKVDGDFHIEDDKLFRSLVLSDLFVLHDDVSMVFFFFCFATWNKDKLTKSILVTVKESMVTSY
jgi:hypothetical protein